MEFIVTGGIEIIVRTGISECPGPPLGRPSKDPIGRKQLAKQAYEYGKLRIPIEGKFGNGKRKYVLNRIKKKLRKN